MTSDRVRRVAGVLLVAVVVALGGCGQSETDKYKEDVQAAIKPLRSTLDSTNERVAAAQSLKERIAELDKTRRALDAAAAKLEKLDPPADAKAEHDNFVEQLHRFAADIRRFAKAANGDRPLAVRRALGALRLDTARLKDANDALKAKVGE
jgi:DNA repair exonuclease SbcCD ATPase subunit